MNALLHLRDLTTETTPHTGPVGLAALQAAVGGDIELVRLTPDLDMWINGNGKIEGLPYNALATICADAFGAIMPSDEIVGNAVVCSSNRDGDSVPLTPAQLAHINRAMDDDPVAAFFA